MSDVSSARPPPPPDDETPTPPSREPFFSWTRGTLLLTAIMLIAFFSAGAFLQGIWIAAVGAISYLVFAVVWGVYYLVPYTSDWAAEKGDYRLRYLLSDRKAAPQRRLIARSLVHEFAQLAEEGTPEMVKIMDIMEHRMLQRYRGAYGKVKQEAIRDLGLDTSEGAMEDRLKNKALDRVFGYAESLKDKEGNPTFIAELAHDFREEARQGLIGRRRKGEGQSESGYMGR